MPAGRPSSFTQETADAICERLARGETLIAICRDEAMPGQSTVFRWLEANEQFREKYARARQEQADHFAEETIAIADEDPVYVIDAGDDAPEVRIDSGFVARQRLRVDARKWFASKVAPKKYGERVDMQHSGSVGLEALVSQAGKIASGE